ncbi:hypothetical protein [Mesorhizobium sp. M0977]|uniref:hypothetical protein n=1 Tax=Mesorhizobium sp. M0977 TaxID=2957039 RepID=UPI0033353CE0
MGVHVSTAYRMPLAFRPGMSARANTKAERELARLRKAHATVAQLVAIDLVYLPIFDRLEAEIAAAEAELIKDPIAKARAIAASQRKRT